jgi:hypothetical protein
MHQTSPDDVGPAYDPATGRFLPFWGGDRGRLAHGSATGCRFRSRCPHAMDVCAVEDPAPTFDGDLTVRCHLAAPRWARRMSRIATQQASGTLS